MGGPAAKEESRYMAADYAHIRCVQKDLELEGLVIYRLIIYIYLHPPAQATVQHSSAFHRVLCPQCVTTIRCQDCVATK